MDRTPRKPRTVQKLDKPNVRVWFDARDEEPEDFNFAKGAFEVDQVAEMYMAEKHADHDYPRCKTVFVRDTTGKVYEFEVRAEMSYDFIAERRLA